MTGRAGVGCGQILVDMIVREIENLPGHDPILPDYLALLSHVSRPCQGHGKAFSPAVLRGGYQ
jgi:hypothetical protein